MHTLSYSRVGRGLGLLAVTALLAAGCGSGSSDKDSSKPSNTTGAPSTPSDDPFAPQPLAETTKFKVGLVAQGQEPYAPVELAKQLGEFEKENLDVEISQITIPDAAVLLNQGRIDTAPLVLTVGVFNQLETDPDFRLGAGLPNLPASSKAGIWVSDKYVDSDGTMDPCDFEGLTVGFGPSLKGATAAAGLLQELKKCDLTLDDIDASPLQGPNANIAIQQGSLDAAVVFDPLWEQLEEDGSAHLIVPLYGEGSIFEGTSPTGWFFGPVRHKDPEAVKAFLRATGRVTRDYFSGDYHQDADTRALLADVLGVPEATFLSTPSLEADPTMPVDSDIVTTMQDSWLEIGLLEFDEALPLDRVVDQAAREDLFGT